MVKPWENKNTAIATTCH